MKNFANSFLATAKGVATRGVSGFGKGTHYGYEYDDLPQIKTEVVEKKIQIKPIESKLPKEVAPIEVKPNQQALPKAEKKPYGRGAHYGYEYGDVPDSAPQLVVGKPAEKVVYINPNLGQQQ
jgi:hypothetical protein